MLSNDQGPRLCVEAVIKTDRGVVMVKRASESYAGFWHLPGGAVKYGEMLVEAVKRVVRAETGMEVEAERVLGYVEYPDEVQVRGFGWSVGIVFGAKITAGELTGRVPEEEVGEFEKLPEQLITEQRDFLIRKEILT